MSSFLLLHYILWTVHLRDEHHKLSLMFMAKVVCAVVNSIHAYIVFYFVTTIFWDGIQFMFIFSIFVFDRFRCYEQRYLTPVAGHLPTRSLYNFMWHHNVTLRWVLSLNRIFGGTFLLVLLVIYPLNSYLLIHVLVDPFHFLNLAFRLLYISHMYYYIFFIHLLAVMHSLRIHRFTRQLFRLSPRLHHLSSSSLSLSLHLRLLHYLEHFHTSKKYGFTYSKFGLISFTAFLKFLFVYIRFMFMFYKSSRGSN